MRARTGGGLRRSRHLLPLALASLVPLLVPGVGGATTVRRKPAPKVVAKPARQPAAAAVRTAPVDVTPGRPVRAIVYSDSYQVYPGLHVDSDAFRTRLRRLGYQRDDAAPAREGTYSISASARTMDLHLHRFEYADRTEPGRAFHAVLDEGGRIIAIRIAGEGGEEVPGFELEPLRLSGDAGRGGAEGLDDEGRLRAPNFLDFVSRELQRRFPSRVAEDGTWRVFTTLDPEMQVIADAVVADNVVEMEHDIGPALAEAGEPLQAAMVVLEPGTGAIRAMVGGRDAGRGTAFNRAIDMSRQPGSTFKSIVALAALGGEKVGAVHFRPTSTVVDERMQWEWKGQVWSPRNYEGEFYGPVTIREAIEHSLNSAVARIAKDVGVKPIRDLAVRLGMTPELGVYPSIVLGGQPVPLLDMAKVFSVYASGGLRVDPTALHGAMDSSGNFAGGSPTESRRVVPAADAYMVTHILEGVMERGTGATARRKGFKHPAAGKTGTSNDYRDAWFVGFTPNLLTAVWVGFDNGSSMGLAGSEAALPIWTDFMRQALGDTPHDSFLVPPGIVLADVDKKDGLLARPECPKQVREAFLAGEEPHARCEEHGGEWR